MRTTRLITAGLAAASLAAAGPAAAVAADGGGAGSGASRPVPAPPSWPEHPWPVTRPVVAATPTPVPASPPTWPANPQPIPPPPAVDTATTPEPGFDEGSAAIGAMSMLAAIAIALGGAMGLRRRGLRFGSSTTQ